MTIDREPVPATRTTFFGSSWLAAALLVGCGAPVDFSEENFEEPVAAETAALGRTVGTYTWRAGDPAVDMGPGINRVCFLTRIRGAMNARRASVFVQGGGLSNWYLTGSGVHEKVTATASCMAIEGPARYAVEESYEFNPDFPEHFKVIGDANGADISTTDYSCFLTSVGGQFFGEGDEVRVRIQSNKWIMDGRSTGSNIGSVEARARCVKRPRGPSFSWTAPNSPVNLAAAPAGSTPPACFLTRVGGHISEGSSVGVSRPTQFSYALTGSQPEGDALSARVLCLE